jgi:hypothetical protein
MMRSSKAIALQGLVALLVAGLARPPVAVASPLSLTPSVTLTAAGPKVGVFFVGLDARAAQEKGLLEDAAEAALTRATRFTVVPVQDVFNPAAAMGRKRRADDATKQAQVGKQALEELDSEKANAAFAAALEDRKQGDLSRDFQALLDAWIMKAAGHATGGETGPAKKDIEAVVALAPKSEFSPSLFPPDLIKFAEQQKKLAANAKGELLVRTEPPGARVWVDGVFRGQSPVTVAGLGAGKHFVTAALGGYALSQVEVGPGEELLRLEPSELAPAWKKASTEAAADPEGPGRDAAAKALGKAAQLDQVLVIVAKKSLAGEQLDLIGLRLATTDGHNLAYRAGTVKVSDAEQLEAFFDALALSDARRDGKNPVTHFKGGGSSPVKTVAGFSLIGLGVAGVIVGSIFGGAALGAAEEFRQTPQVQRVKSEQLRADGQAFAAVADVSFIVGLASAAAGTVLLVTNRGDAAAAPSTPDTGKSAAARRDEAKRREAERRALEDRRAAEERQREDERRRAEERQREQQRAEERRKEEERRREEDRRREEEAAARRKADEEKAAKMSKKEREAFEKRQREEEERQRREEEERRAKEDAERRAREQEEAARRKAEEERIRKQREEEQRRREEQRRKEAEEDLRNF